MLFLTIRFFRGRLDWQFGAGCTILSGFWCLLILLKMQHFLQTYFDVFSRLEVLLPCAFGLALSGVALFTEARTETHVVDGALLLMWLAVYAKYCANKAKFKQQGHGPVPDGTWISPPIEELGSGDLVLTNGAVAAHLHESVGHAFVVLEKDGVKLALSSHMDRGCTLDPIEEAVGEVRGGYIVLKLAEPFTKEQSDEAVAVAESMVKRNLNWKRQRTKAWHEFVDRLSFLPASLLDRLRNAYRCTGYDWVGMLAGRIAQNNWTCIGAGLDLYHTMGVHTSPYGTGLFGFGTTLFDPIMPVRFLNDPAFRLLRTKQPDKKQKSVIFTSSHKI